MKTIVVDAVAESRGAFLELVHNAPAAFLEAHAGAPSEEMERNIEFMREDELLLRFDIGKHTEEARSRFCSVSELERMAYRFSTDKNEKPLPYVGAFVPSIGHIGLAWTQHEVIELMQRARKDKERTKDMLRHAQKAIGN